MQTSYLACEGPHDAALLGCFLKNSDYKLLKTRSEVVAGPFARLMPPSLPDALFGRDPMPNVWYKLLTAADPTSAHWVAVHPVGGDGNLPKALARITGQTSRALDAVGAFIDADQSSPASRVTDLESAIFKINPSAGFAFSGGPGVITTTVALRTGVYVMPDNINPGSVESILNECAKTSYADLHAHAGTYLLNINSTLLSQDERLRLAKGSNPAKAHLGVIGAVLRPGAAIQNTIRDDRWIDTTTLGLPLVTPLRTFLRDLLNDPAI